MVRFLMSEEPLYAGRNQNLKALKVQVALESWIH